MPQAAKAPQSEAAGSRPDPRQGQRQARARHIANALPELPSEPIDGEGMETPSPAKPAIPKRQRANGKPSKAKPPELHAKLGRPTLYTLEHDLAICEHIAEGGSLPAWCKADTETRPKLSTIYAWLEKYPDFQDRYTRARELQADSAVDLALDDIEAAKDKETAAVARVRADTRLKVAAMRDPSRFGPKASPHSGVSVTIITPLGRPSPPSSNGGFLIDLNPGTNQTQEPRALPSDVALSPANTGVSNGAAKGNHFPNEEAGGIDREGKP